MAVATFEGFVKEGHIRLTGSARLPEKTRVYVVVPDLEPAPPTVAYIGSPHLAHPEQAALFVKEVVEDFARNP